jgi:hypothetical protein
MRWLLLFIPFNLMGQFTHTVNIYDANSIPIDNVEVKLYRRTIPNIPGFTQQTNYNGHSYYRSTTSSTWTNAKTTCENMGGHLATISSSAENSFLFNTWPSGWIGLYQDKTGAFYSEPNGGWRWTEIENTDAKHNFDTKNYTTTLVDNMGFANATMYNGPTLVTTGGNYVQFDGVNDYAITGNLAPSFPNAQKIQTLQLLCYPQSTGVLVTELGVGDANSGWHASVMEITSSGTLRVGFWNGTGISNISTPITMNTWHEITMTYDGTSLRGYLDGTYFGIITFNREVPHSNSGNGMYYALAKSDATNMGNGTFGQYRLGNFRVFNRVLTDDEIDRSWMYISYRYGRMKYTNWNGGEPNNSGGEDYIQFVTNGRWNDLPNTSLPYVIEFDYIVTTTPWTVHSTNTTSNGRVAYSYPTDPSKEYYVEVRVPTTTSTVSSDDYSYLSDVFLGETSLKSYHYHQWDLNMDGSISVGDLLYLIKSVLGLQSWVNQTYLFTQSEWNSLNANTTNLTTTIQGNTTTYTFNINSGGTTNLYLLTKGFGDQSQVRYQ